MSGSGGSYTYTAINPLAIPRLGHSASPLPGGQVLITGGLRRTGDAPNFGPSLRLVTTAEVIQLSDTPDPLMVCEDQAPSDGGVPMDSGMPDTGPPPMDSGMGDAMPGDAMPGDAAMMDAGMADTGM